MARYRVKLIDHTASDAARVAATITRHTQELFDEALGGTSDSVAVAWGAGSTSDNYVVHFVEDQTPANSYLRRAWPSMTVDPRAGGHTHSHGTLSGTEIYKFAGVTRTKLSGLGYAKLILHEFFHNQFPFRTSDEVHGGWGGGGLAASTPVLGEPPNRVNERNKLLIRQGFSVQTKQLL